MANENLYTQEVTIPSKGLLSPSLSEGKLTLRCMMVADKKFLAGSTRMDGEEIVEKLVERCIVSPEKFEVKNLSRQDLMYLLFKLRILSYGDTYSYKTKCSDCGKKIEVKLNLTELETYELEEGFQNNLSVVLPHRGDTVFTQFVVLEDEHAIKKEVKRMKKKFPDMQSDPGLTIGLSKMITRIELKEPNGAGDDVLEDPIDILKYVEDLSDLDSIAIQSTTGNMKFGVSPTADYVCPECGEDIEINVSFSGEFFRPKYDGKSR